MSIRHQGNHIEIVKGTQGYALYDLWAQNVYHLNQAAWNVIQRYINGENTFNESERPIIDILESIEFTNNLFNTSPSQITPVLTYAWLEITEACNMNCIHCYGEWGHPIEKSDKYLTCDEWKNVIDRIWDVGCRSIQLIGGEPLISPYFSELLRYAYYKGMKHIDIFTNGTLINEKLIELFEETHSYIRVSLYGHTANIHDAITKHPGSFEKTIKNISLLEAHNIPVSIAVIIMDLNEKYTNEIEAFITQMGSHGYDTIRQTTYGQQLKHAVSRSEVLKPRYQCKASFNTSRESFYKNQKWNSCWFGKIAITSKGDIIPCIFARECVLGNIRIDPSEKIKKEILKAWSITKDQVTECCNCEYRYSCHDCRPLAKGLSGNLYAKYPRCCYDPANGIWNNIEQVTNELKK